MGASGSPIGGYGEVPVPPDSRPFPAAPSSGQVGLRPTVPLEGRSTLGGLVRETFLDNGLRVLTEQIPGVRSVSLGVWVRQGSAHEDPAFMGASHLLEHMVFKGTERRGPKEIAMALESLGGSLDAYTSREHTSYQARVLDENLGEALDVLADLVRFPRLREEDLELEREVVLEEISTVHDTPDDLVFELHGEELWAGHPYGYSILGTRDTVNSLPVDVLRDLHARRYQGGNLVVAGAGRLEHDAFVAEVERLFGELPRGESPPVVPPITDVPQGERRVVRDSAQQVHIVFGSPTPPRNHPSRYPLILLSSAFGGGMSSRLFQRVREELGLAYAVYSFQSFYGTGGINGVYLGTRPEWGDRAVETVREELGRLAREGLANDELAEIKRQVKGQVMLSLESTNARLYRLAGFALYDQPYLTLDDVLALIDGITRDEVAEVAARSFDPDAQLILRLGPKGSGKQSSPRATSP